MKIAVLGAGAAGTAISRLLANEESVTSLRVIDRNGNALEELETSIASPKIRVHRVNIEKEMSLSGLLKGCACVISALPYKHDYRIASIVLKAGINYVDLGGDDSITEKQLTLYEAARNANVILIPNAGFAPGLVNVLAMHGFESFDSVHSIVIRSGALPKHPIAPLNHHLSFSPVGLVNEYLNTVTIIHEGELKEVEALDGYETCALKAHPDLGPLEAFYTSGSATFLARELQGKVEHFDNKTLRFKGHRDIIKAFFELGFNSSQIIDIRSSITYRDLFIRQLKKFLPQTKEDIAVAKVIIKGKRSDTEIIREYEVYLESDVTASVSAMMTVTAQSAVCTALLLSGRKVQGPGGVFLPEFSLPKDEYIEMLTRRGVAISVTESEA